MKGLAWIAFQVSGGPKLPFSVSHTVCVQSSLLIEGSRAANGYFNESQTICRAVWLLGKGSPFATCVLRIVKSGIGL